MIFALLGIILLAKLASYISIKLGQPLVLGELLVGILLGPTLLDLTHLPFLSDTHLTEVVIQIGELGVLLLMFIAGLELHLSELAKNTRVSADGLETIFATNHICIFLMTHLLLGLLQASAPSRIITVASRGLVTYPFLDIEFDNLNGERKYSTQHAYYHAKLAQVMSTYTLAERL